MKLRLKSDSIRLRLSQGEVSRLVSDGFVEESVRISVEGPTFAYAVEAKGETTAINVSLKRDRLTIFLPYPSVKRWATTDEIGIDENVDNLRILVEKDFACLKPRHGEDESDMFPNPNLEHC